MLHQNPLWLDASVCDKHYWHRNRANTSPHLFAKERTKDLRSKDAKKIHALFRQRNDEHVPSTMRPNIFLMRILIFMHMYFLRNLSKIRAKGQLISKCPFGIFKSTKKPTKYLYGFLPKPLKVS